MSARAGIGRAVVVGAAVLTLTSAPAVRAMADDAPFTIDRPLALTGLAADADRSVYWAVEDPTKGSLVALTPEGQVQGRMTFTTKVTNVQALASRSGVVYVGDIGDPQRTREFIRVLRIGEPGTGAVEPTVWTFQYPDGAHDAAALMISSRGTLFVVTRGERPGIYRTTSQPSAERTNVLQRVADAPAGVSDGAFVPGSGSFYLWADTGLHKMDGYDFSTDAIGAVPRVGEALAIGLEGKVMLGVGGAKPRVTAEDVPVGHNPVTPSPTPTPTPSRKPTPTPSATPSPSVATEEQSAADSPKRTGTFIALGGAAGLAALAGVVTLVPWRRRPAGAEAAGDRPAED